ncbi:phage major capsid protein [Pacificitalea manganoxidans]|uniref:Phage major capsid protein n=1 Tax=Pacificitalea manganoxidans TaxID=1411902 RepID=A0A291LZ41_9RHOB|nr:phage major capsid protein [Pacificitalea manganoxidans]ATI41940.1 phage major capsid protein [Pacificitalea manganoxidans]MDR6309428.1 HK97 family phage major capsid protein/HK97 family phage prohead protease [Pacificitalea manganoxidans]
MADDHRQAGGLAAALLGHCLTRAVTAEQINAGGTQGQLRRTGEVRNVDTEARTVELAFSSETEVERWFGTEVLDHRPGAMRSERLAGGAALLVNHDWHDQIGVVDRVLEGTDAHRAVVRFGRGPRADEIFRDVQDGIRRHVSVGYVVHRVEVETRKGQSDLVRITDWEPLEISIVSVPADPNVGVGRSLETGSPSGATLNEQGNTGMHTKITRDASGNLVRAKVDDDGNIVEVLEIIERAGEDAAAAQRRGSEAERARVRAIIEMGDQYGAPDLARDHVRDGRTAAEMQAALLAHLAEGRSAPLTEAEGADIGLTGREAESFSFTRALRALANPADRRAQEAAAFEFEASAAAAQRSGRDPQGILVPADVLRRALNTASDGSAAGDTGGYSVDNELMSQSFVEMLRNRTVAMQLGRVMGGLVGNITVPRQAAGASGYWIGEDEDATEDNLELDQIGMSPKTVAAYSEITRRLLMQSSLDVEAIVRADLASALGLTIDKAFFYGTGSDNQPRGIKNYAGINAVDFGTDGAGAGTGQMPSYAEIVAMESAIAADNADVNAMAYVMNSGMRGHCKTTPKFTGGADQGLIWEPGGTVNGYRSEVTNQIAAGDLFFGNFADALIGMWGGLEINVDPYTHSKKGRLRVVAMQDVDFVLRRLESFCYGADSTA